MLILRRNARDGREMKTRIIQVNPNKQTILVDRVLPNLTCGDVIVASPTGEIRNHALLKWHQRLWLKIDKKMRQWLGIDKSPVLMENDG
jgi:hypothetical protein